MTSSPKGFAALAGQVMLTRLVVIVAVGDDDAAAEQGSDEREREEETTHGLCLFFVEQPHGKAGSSARPWHVNFPKG